jgi:hypothetical protein
MQCCRYVGETLATPLPVSYTFLRAVTSPKTGEPSRSICPRLPGDPYKHENRIL